MPIDFKCPNCNLRISTGGFHYHDFSSGYSGRLLIACLSCGTQHAIETALPDRGPESFPMFRLVVESLPESAHVSAASWLHREKKLDLKESLAAIRTQPFTIFDETWQEKAELAARELTKHGAKVRIDQVASKPNPCFGPKQQDRLLYRENPLFEEPSSEWLVGPTLSNCDIRTLSCQHCKSVGTLRDDLVFSASCPACKQWQLVVESEWRT